MSVSLSFTCSLLQIVKLLASQIDLYFMDLFRSNRQHFNVISKIPRGSHAYGFVIMWPATEETGSPALEILLAVRNSLYVRCQQIFRIFAPYSGYFGSAWTPVYSFPSCNKLVDSHSLPLYFFSVNVNIILPPNPGLSKLSLYGRNY